MLISKAIVVQMAISLGLSNDQVEKAALDYKLVSTDNYDADLHKEKVNAAAASLLAGYLMIQSQSEGSFSVTFSKDEIKNRIKFLAENSGGLFDVPIELQALDRRVRAVSVW